jgi:hypothetical protein
MKLFSSGVMCFRSKDTHGVEPDRTRMSQHIEEKFNQVSQTTIDYLLKFKPVYNVKFDKY